MAVAACPHDGGFWRRFDRGVFVAVLAVGVGWLTIESATRPYDADEVAVGQASASVVLRGGNPYGRDLTPQLHQFSVPPRVSTPLLDGGTVHTTSYPALSFLLAVPMGALLGQGGHFAQTATVIGWGATLVLLWRLLPVGARPFMPVLASASFFVELISGGNTDFLFVPFLCLAFWRWHRYGAGDEPSPARWVGPVALGLACAVKQTPWLMAPLLISGVALEAHRRGDRWLPIAGRYAAVAGGAFLAPNLPFIIASPAAWIREVLLPLSQPLIPYGQGLIQLIMALGGGRLAPYALAALAAEMTALLGFIALYPRSRRLLPVLGILPLVVATRSLANYFVVILPPLLVGAATVPWSPDRPSRRWRGRLVGASAAVSAIVVAASIAAVATPAPVRFTAVSGGTGAGGDGRPVTRLEVRLRNTSGSAVCPSFVTLEGIEYAPGWRTVRGPATLNAGAEANYTLVSSDPRIAVTPGNTFEVAALVSQPASISLSAMVTATTLSDGAAPIP